MKTMSLIVALILSLAPMGSAWATQTSPVKLYSAGNLSAFDLSLTGELSNTTGGEQCLVAAAQTKSSHEALNLHPAQLSIPGVVDENVLQPKGLLRSVPSDQNSSLACP